MNTFAIIPLFLGNIRGWQLLIIVLVVLLLFGGKKIPELMKGLGQGIRAFKQGMNEMQQEINRKDDTPDAPAK
ncbi:MAG: twin-arginine translocase TatA/TatE family subunit [Bacteroidales bacterium]|nr:twin-arginine translocase TatA/TatE family subunit [Bacteroidales bacterium]MCD8394430.1 twin-arginine translocase TatA/TatE family subunit [Bacteroidales bacterium]